jgi:hypothetical protein
MRQLLFITLILFSGTALKAQKSVTIALKEDVIKQAISELDQAMTPPEGALYKFAQKYHVTGEYTLQMTIRKKGEVASVFVSDNKDGNIPSQNSLKDKIFDFKFNFKMPKNNDYKFSYTFKF